MGTDYLMKIHPEPEDCTICVGIMNLTMVAGLPMRC